MKRARSGAPRVELETMRRAPAGSFGMKQKLLVRMGRFLDSVQRSLFTACSWRKNPQGLFGASSPRLLVTDQIRNAGTNPPNLPQTKKEHFV